MDEATRDAFDRLLEGVLAELPADLHELLAEVPLVVEDYPGDDVAAAFDLEYRDELCGLHDGIPLTERSVEGGEAPMPDHITIYREGIMAMAADEDGEVDTDELVHQIRITVLHEIGHHFGLDEDQLAELGYD